MKTQLLFSIVTSISLFASVSLPVVAETVPNPVEAPVELKDITLAKNTAIIISFPAAMTVDVTEKQDFPLTVFLSKAIKDNRGNILVPENSPVSIILKPTGKGAKIIAQSLVVNSQVLPIKASSPIIPGGTVVHTTGNEKAEENGSVWSKIGENTFGFISGGKTEESQKGSMLGTTLGLLAGLNTPKKSRVV